MTRNKNLNNKNGFSLLEVIVAMGLFSFVIVIAVGIFANGSQAQKNTEELHVVQEEGSYLLEMISRELRMATEIDSGQQGNKDHEIVFKNHKGVSVTYCRSDGSGVCSASGDYLARNTKVISSSKIEIINLKFYTSENFTSDQPLITFSIKIKSKISGGSDTELFLQNSIAMRIY